MNFIEGLALFLVVGLTAYLFFVLLAPEKLS